MINFETNHIFLIKLFLHDQKIMRKITVSWERKELLRWNKKHFSLIWKDFLRSKKNIFFGVWEPDFNRWFLSEVSYIIWQPNILTSLTTSRGLTYSSLKTIFLKKSPLQKICFLKIAKSLEKTFCIFYKR